MKVARRPWRRATSFTTYFSSAALSAASSAELGPTLISSCPGPPSVWLDSTGTPAASSVARISPTIGSASSPRVIDQQRWSSLTGCQSSVQR